MQLGKVKYKRKNGTNKNKLSNIIMMIQWYEHNGKCTEEGKKRVVLGAIWYLIVCWWDVEMLMISSRKNVNDLRKMEEDGDGILELNPINWSSKSQLVLVFGDWIASAVMDDYACD